MATGFMTLALVITAAEPPGLQRGDEFAFSGTLTEDVARPNKRLHRDYKLEMRLFVLEREDTYSDAALLTQLWRNEDAVGGAARPVTGDAPNQNAPPILRLDFVRIHADGTAHLLLPSGPPFHLTGQTQGRVLPAIPLTAFAPADFVEFGLFPPRIPVNLAPNEPWTVAAASNRPNETWALAKREFINAEQCTVLLMNQKSADWEQPVGGQTSWHRADKIWVSTPDRLARKVYRVIQERDGLSTIAASWIVVDYEMKEHEKLIGRTYERTRRDVEMGYTALAEASRLVRDAAKLGPRVFETKLAELNSYLDETAPGTPFRVAAVAARRTMEAARRGDVAAPQSRTSTPAPVAPVQNARWPEPGQRAPDVRFGNRQLSEAKGKPVVLVFLKPDGETTELALAIADALGKRYESRAAVVPLVVFGEVSRARNDCERLKLSVPLYDGAAAAATYGVATVPRFAVIDPEGKVQWTFTGVGAETGYLIKEEVDRLARPVLPDGPRGINVSSGTAVLPPVPRP